MTLEERMVSTHLDSLSFHYKDDYKKMKFKECFVDKSDRYSIVSISSLKKEIYYTRHDMTGVITHSVVLRDDMVSRYYELS